MNAPDLALHPLVIAVTSEAVIIDGSAQVVYLSDGLADVLSRAGQIGLRPVLLTTPDVQLTFAARYLLESLGGAWVQTRADGTVVSPVTGVIREYVTDFVRPDRKDKTLGHVELAPPPVLNAGMSVTVHHSATDTLTVGALAESLASGLAGDEIAGWDVYEPAVQSWDRERLTTYARRRMPDDVRVQLVGAEGRFLANMLVRRTSGGVEETVVALAQVPQDAHGANDIERITARASSTLTSIARDFRMPLVGMVSAVTGWPDLSQRTGRAAPPVPVALLVGPRATHMLNAADADVKGLPHVQMVGSSRLPSALAVFEPHPQGSWDQLADLVKRVGYDTVALAAGIAAPDGQTSREEAP